VLFAITTPSRALLCEGCAEGEALLDFDGVGDGDFFFFEVGVGEAFFDVGVGVDFFGVGVGEGFLVVAAFEPSPKTPGIKAPSSVKKSLREISDMRQIVGKRR